MVGAVLLSSSPEATETGSRSSLCATTVTRFHLAPDPDHPLAAIPATRDSPPLSRDFPSPQLSPPATSLSRTLPGRSPETSPLQLYRSFLSCVLPHSSHTTWILDCPTISSPIGRISLTTGSGLHSFCPSPHLTSSHFYFSCSPFGLIHFPFPDRVLTLAPPAATFPVGYEFCTLVTVTQALFLCSLSVVSCSLVSVRGFSFRLYRFIEIPSSPDFIMRFPPRCLVVLYKPM